MRDAMDSFVYAMALLHCWIVKVWTVLPAYYALLSKLNRKMDTKGLRLEPSLHMCFYKVSAIANIPASCSCAVSRYEFPAWSD